MSQVSCIPFRLQPLAVGVSLALLASCGGGGSPTPTPTSPVNSAPTFTSATSTSAAENGTGTVYTASATDPNGDPLTFSIAGGPDASAFALSGGALSFRSAPNFDLYFDSDGNNVYSVILQVSDGRGGTATTTVDVMLTNEREGISVSRIATGFDDPVGMDRSLATQGLVIAERDGTVWDVDGSTGAKRELTPIPLGANGEVIDIAFGQNSSMLRGRVVMLRSSAGITLYRPDAGSSIDADLATGAPSGAGGSIWFGND
ncbi:MAG: Ig-like domain-containing protein [Altererythrobacter sp.]